MLDFRKLQENLIINVASNVESGAGNPGSSVTLVTTMTVTETHVSPKLLHPTITRQPLLVRTITNAAFDLVRWSLRAELSGVDTSFQID